MGLYFWILTSILHYALTQHSPSDTDGLHDLMRRQCPNGMFGFQCRFHCRCSGNDNCNKVTGTCSRDCADGFWGPGCQLSNDCFYNGQTRNYMGRVLVTKERLECQAWESHYPHEHNYMERDFPDGTYPKNYCRTTADSSKPWCYTRNTTQRWSYCNIGNCLCPAGLFGHNCAKMCHCKDPAENCDSILGHCKSGCDHGWTGFDCQTPQACPTHTYGWSCESECKCQSSAHCHRFTGPTSECQCREGYFNPPQCEPVTKPRIVEFVNEQVNPGQPTLFNCTVSAFPTPLESEIRLVAPEGRRVMLQSSYLLTEYSYTRKNTFLVMYPNLRSVYALDNVTNMVSERSGGQRKIG